MTKTILHCDLNNFFASVECLKFPQLKGLPVAVCGSIENRHGIILAKNDAAKAFGVKTAEVVWQAKQKCPDLILLPPHMEEYVEASRKAHEIYSKYTDLIEPFGIDECWLDVTGSSLLFGNGEEIANRLREEMKQTLSLTISVGVSFNKIFAKLGSDMKKPDAVTVISQENYKQLVWPLPVNELLGIGSATARALSKYGISTIGELAAADEAFLSGKLGKVGAELVKNANGQGDSLVRHQDAEEEIKSIGNSTTYPSDLKNKEEIRNALYELSESVCSRLRKHSLLACGISITIKDSSLFARECQSPLPFPTRLPGELVKAGMALFEKNFRFEKNVRMVGVKSFHLIPDNESLQCSLIGDAEKEEELEQLERKIYDLRGRFGTASVQRASLLKNTDKDEK